MGTGFFEFGAFRLDAATPVLWRGSRVVSLTPKALALLHVLVEARGDVVPKAVLMARVWPDAAVAEANLNVTVSALRKGLGVQDDGRSWIETVPRRGYRFDGPVRGPAAPFGLSLAVLPFQLVGAAPEPHLGLGLADALIARLTGAEGLRVRPTAAVAHLAGTALSPQRIARDLGVQAVLGGTVQRDGDRLRLSVELVETGAAHPPWAGRFEFGFTDLFDVQDRVAEQVAAALRTRLASSGEPPAVHHAPPAAASEAYLRGRYFWARLDPAGVSKAIAYFGEAALEDPAWAAPHAGLAGAHVLLGMGGIVPPAKAARLAAECVARALEDDPALPEAHVSAALVAFFCDWDLGAARRSLERALSLQPEAHATRLLYGLLLGLSEDFEGARRELGRVREADPVSGLAGAVVAFFQGLVGEPERRLHSARRALELRPDRGLSYWALGLAHEGLGHHGRAVAALRRAVELTDGGTVMKAQLAWALARAGHSTEARSLLRELDRVSGHTFVSPYHRALALVALGEREEALVALERAAEARDPWVVFLKADPALRGLRGEARYESLVSRVLRP